MMKKIKFKKKEKNNQLIVEVQLPERRFVPEPVIEFSNSDLIAYLEQSGINVQDYELKNATNETLTSYATKGVPPILNGVWTFDKKTKKVEQKLNKKNTRTYNKKVKENPTGD